MFKSKNKIIQYSLKPLCIQTYLDKINSIFNFPNFQYYILNSLMAGGNIYYNIV